MKKILVLFIIICFSNSVFSQLTLKKVNHEIYRAQKNIEFVNKKQIKRCFRVRNNDFVKNLLFELNAKDTLFIKECILVQDGSREYRSTIWNDKVELNYSSPIYKDTVELLNFSTLEYYHKSLIEKWDIEGIRNEEKLNGLENSNTVYISMLIFNENNLEVKSFQHEEFFLFERDANNF